MANYIRGFVYIQLRKLGFKTMKQYYASPLWEASKLRYRRSKCKQVCIVCDCPKVHIHHRRYANLGTEPITDLAPLCATCHGLVHRAHRTYNIPLCLTEDAIQAVLGKPPNEPRKPQAKIGLIIKKLRKSGMERNEAIRQAYQRAGKPVPECVSLDQSKMKKYPPKPIGRLCPKCNQKRPLRYFLKTGPNCLHC